MQIRRLSAADLPLLRGMNQLFAVAFDDHGSYSDAPPADGYLHERLADDRFVALVALDGDAVTGGLAAYELRKFEQARSELYIYDLAVAEAYRRQGIASALIGWLQDHARNIGAWTIFVQADPPDEPALALYRKLGVVEERVLHFDISPSSFP